MSAPPSPLIGLFAWFVRALSDVVVRHQLGRVPEGRVPGALMPLIFARINHIRDRFAHLAARLIAGTFTPRRTGPHRQPVTQKPRETSSLQKFGWLAELLPAEVAREQRANLFHILQQPETAALIAAAPAQVARLLRPMCWMLKLKPPKLLPSVRGAAAIVPVRYQPPPPRPPAPPPAPTNTLGLPLISLAPSPPKPKIA